MGYRVYLGKIPKHDRKQFMHLKDYNTAYDFWEKRKDTSYSPEGYVELAELGKYVEYVSDGFELEEFYNYDLSEEEFVIAPRELLVFIIEQYRQSTLEFYQEAVRTIDSGDVNKVKRHLENKVTEWDTMYYSNFNTAPQDHAESYPDVRLTKSWKFEYAIFNLLHLLHTFDWDNNYLIYSGH
jgi:hypothetical protein